MTPGQGMTAHEGSEAQPWEESETVLQFRSMHVFGIDAGGTKTMCLLADEEGRIVGEARGGGGFWIGRAALTAVVRQFDGRGPATLLTPMILEHLDLSTPKELIHEIYYRDVHRHTIAGIAGLVQRAMDEHDAIAADILGRAGAELASAAASVIGRLAMRGDAFPTVLAGG